ncbi:porin [Phycisphaerales bacterium AB-hyl4]|uniref:Porin n=1 Tax=Natronomicrosphaera hydrolytica TaxID=3242702 RepID=A0ABV4U8G2_9BACT
MMSSKSRLVTYRWIALFALLPTAFTLAGGRVLADDFDALRDDMQRMQRQLDAQQAVIERQQRELESLRPTDAQERWLDEARSEQVRQLAAEVIADADARDTRRPWAGHDGTFSLRSADGRFRLNIGALLQPRYVYTHRAGDAEDSSTFTINRAQLDFAGHVFDPRFTFRLMPEFARDPEMLDAWVNFAFMDQLQVRAGQFTVPFQWHRVITHRRQHFSQRGLASETFGVPGGYDIGLMVHGRGSQRDWDYALGFFGGEGRNVGITEGTGHMAVARMSYALMGTLPTAESDITTMDGPGLSVGGGLLGAWDNTLRDWDRGQSLVGDTAGDWLAATADVHYRWLGISLAADGYWRHVSPSDSAVASYDGWGFGVSAGYTFMPELYEVVARVGQAMADTNVGDTRQREYGIGLNIYHEGHAWKTRLNYLYLDTPLGDSGRFILEHHLDF